MAATSAVGARAPLNIILETEKNIKEKRLYPVRNRPFQPNFSVKPLSGKFYARHDFLDSGVEFLDLEEAITRKYASDPKDRVKDPETVNQEDILTSGSINEYADRTLELLRPAMKKNGFDPFKVEDMSHDFWFKPLFLNYTGHIDLRNGLLRDLSTLRRSGDVRVKYEKKMLTLYVNLTIDSLMIDFDHTLKIFGLGPSGHLSAKIKKQEVQFDILIDFDRLTFHLQQFALNRNQEVKLHLTGLGLGDILVNIIVSALTPFFKDSVTKAVGNQIRNSIELLIEKLPPLLPPAPDNMCAEEVISVIELLMTDVISDLRYPRLFKVD